MKNFYSLFYHPAIICLLLLLFFSCKPTKKIQAPAPVFQKLPPEILDKKLKDGKISAEWFSGKMKIDLNSPAQNNSFTANIRMKSDSIIWVLVSTVFGIEVARVLISKDSIKVMDKFNKKLILRDFTFFNTYFPHPVDFSVLQNMIFGNPVFYNEKNISSGLNDSLYVLISDDEKIKNTLFLNKNFELTSCTMSDKTTLNQMTVQLQNYKSTSQRNFSFKRMMEIQKGEKIMVLMDFEKAIFNEPTDFPFTIKENYSQEK